MDKESTATEVPQRLHRRVSARVRDPQLSFVAFLVTALIIATLLFVVGYLLYVHSSEYKLDITRPGLKGINSNDLVQVNSDTTYDSTSPIDRKALQSEKNAMNSRLQDLDHYGDFSDQSLTNAENTALGNVSPGQ